MESGNSAASEARKLKDQQGTDASLGPLNPGVEDTKNGEHMYLDVFFW